MSSPVPPPRTVDDLLAAMTPAEKAGQLTQYFYFQLPAGAEADPALGVDAGKLVGAAVGERAGRAGRRRPQPAPKRPRRARPRTGARGARAPRSRR